MRFKTTRELTRALLKASPEEQRRIIWSMTAADVLALDADFEAWAHEAQLPPKREGWRTWLMMAGRGFGKTRAGAEWVETIARSRPGVRIALVGATIDEARRVMVEGVSGVLSVAKMRRHRVKWEPSIGRLKWPNGSEAQLFSGDNPDGLRGPEHDFAWADELAKWGDPEGAWMNLQMGLRRGSRPPVVVVAACSGASWRAVPLAVEIAGAQTTARTATAETVMGTATSTLAVGQSRLLDLANSLDVKLSDIRQWLESRDDDALVAGANLAVIGDEIFQFGSAVPLGDGLFRLSRLLRGRRGTEWAMDLHSAGERFALLDPVHLMSLSIERANIGADLRVTAEGPDDADAVPVDRVIWGEALKPPSPVHLRTSIDLDGNLLCTWARRSRSGWEWLDGVDAPLGCASERYLVTLDGSLGSIVREVSSPSTKFSAGELSGVGGSTVELKVAQVGDFAASHPAAISIPNT